MNLSLEVLWIFHSTKLWEELKVSKNPATLFTKQLSGRFHALTFESSLILPHGIAAIEKDLRVCKWHGLGTLPTSAGKVWLLFGTYSLSKSLQASEVGRTRSFAPCLP